MTSTTWAAAPTPTEQPSVSQLLSDYDRTKRHAAKFGVRLMRRMSHTLMPVMHDSFVFFDKSDRLCVAEAADGGKTFQTQHFSATTFADRIEKALDAGTCIVFGDRRAFKVAIKETDAAAQRLNNGPDRTLAYPLLGALRRMKLASSMRSRAFPVLADVLSEQFWLAPDLDPKSLAVWAKAFNLTGARETIIESLIDQARVGTESGVARAVSKAAITAEAAALKSSVYTGLSSQCAQFKKVEEFNAADKALACLDPIMLERNSISGDVCKLKVLKTNDGSFRATVSTPFKLKPGADVYLLDAAGETVAEVKLMKLTVVTDELIAVFSMPKSKRDMVTTAHTTFERLYATPKPFLLGKGFSQTKWAGNAGDIESIKRDVPLDIILAGAPSA